MSLTSEEIPTTLRVKTIILIEPRTSSYRRTKWGLVPSYDHQKYVKHLNQALKTYHNEFDDPEQPLAIKITYFLRKRKTQEHMVLPACDPDLDNLSKTMLDALKPQKLRRVLVSDGVIQDDNQITDLYVSKRFAKLKPKIKIEIWTIQTELLTESPQQAELFHMPTIVKQKKRS